MIRLRRDRPARVASHTRATIVTGERLQSLAALSLVSARTRAFHRRLDRYAPNAMYFGTYAELSERDLERISQSPSLFVYTHELDMFVHYVWPHLRRPRYVLVTHNSDAEVGQPEVDWLESAGDKLAMWFAQNVTVEHARLVPLPIGIANSMWNHGNLRALADAARRAAKRRPDQELFARYSPGTHPEREELGSALRMHFPRVATDLSRRVSFRAYLNELARHEYCVCPRGNGIDTHRLWEALYLGVTPIVKRSLHTEHWQKQRLPLVIVDQWADLTPDLLAQRRHDDAGDRDSPLLRLDYWRRPVLASMWDDGSGPSTEIAGTPAR